MGLHTGLDALCGSGSGYSEPFATEPGMEGEGGYPDVVLELTAALGSRNVYFADNYPLEALDELLGLLEKHQAATESRRKMNALLADVMAMLDYIGLTTQPFEEGEESYVAGLIQRVGHLRTAILMDS